MKEKSDSPFKLILVIAFLLFIISTLFLTGRIKSEQIMGQPNENKSPNTAKVRISIDTVKEVMSGLYPQYRKIGIPMITITIENPLSKPVSIYLESEIVGISHKTRSIEMVNPDNTIKKRDRRDLGRQAGDVIRQAMRRLHPDGQLLFTMSFRTAALDESISRSFDCRIVDNMLLPRDCERSAGMHRYWQIRHQHGSR